MKLLRTSFLTALGLAVLGLALSLTYQKGVEAQVGSTPVRVVNLATAPALTRDVDRREPYDASQSASSLGTLLNLGLPAVPAGKRLVIEHVTVRADVPFGRQVVCRLFTPVQHELEMGYQGTGFALNSDTYVGSQHLLAFASAGQTPVVRIDRTGNEPITMVLYASISGYLEDL
jgi:hypothetical protein